MAATPLKANRARPPEVPQYRPSTCDFAFASDAVIGSVDSVSRLKALEPCERRSAHRFGNNKSRKTKSGIKRPLERRVTDAAEAAILAPAFRRARLQAFAMTRHARCYALRQAFSSHGGKARSGDGAEALD
jgi:hypothetical protein